MAAVSNAGALGSLSVGATDHHGARALILAVRELTRAPVAINVFAHAPAVADPAVEAAWIERLRPAFAEFGATPPQVLTEIYRSFVDDQAMFRLMLEMRPAVLSFHFGLPPVDWVAELRRAGSVLLATATSLAEAEAAVRAGVHAVVAQGWEAGGHRGVFDPDAPDERIETLPLVRLLSRAIGVPVIAAGGIMTGGHIAEAMRAGAAGAQLGTAFVAADESLANRAYREALVGEAGRRTVMTRAISGRPARGLPTRFTELTAEATSDQVPAYPLAYDIVKALNEAATTKGEPGFGVRWAGTGAPLARALPAAEIVRRLEAELRDAIA
jgi:nitronate monooxygenase